MSDLNVQLNMTGGNDKSDLVYISRDRLARLEAIETALLNSYKASTALSDAMTGTMRPVQEGKPAI